MPRLIFGQVTYRNTRTTLPLPFHGRRLPGRHRCLASSRPRWNCCIQTTLPLHLQGLPGLSLSLWLSLRSVSVPLVCERLSATCSSASCSHLVISLSLPIFRRILGVAFPPPHHPHTKLCLPLPLPVPSKQAGRQLEITSLNGYVESLAHKLGC